jgi:chemotaxis signal transduction protein
MVCFQAAGAAYCIPVQATRAVRTTSGMIALPAPGPDIAGILPGKPPLTVISPLGSGGTHVLVVETGDRTFGLLVESVTGLQRVIDADIRPQPDGQGRPLISGTIDNAGHLVLVADPTALAARL